MTTTVHISGPVFDERFGHLVGEFLRDVVADTAQQAYAEWMTNLNTSIRHPTPYYETQVHVEGDEVRKSVNDRGIVYGPWLEGTGSRNSPVTRFPGYHGLERAVATLEAGQHEREQRILEPYLERMRGRA